MKKLGFVSWWSIVSVTIITTFVDYDFVNVVQSRGGFDAWRASNFLWDTALFGLTLWHVMAVGALFLVYICNKD